jgi:hypothetical protein
MAYAALEAAAWLFRADRRSSGFELRDEYRTLAWEVARDGVGPRVVEDFEYYERLSYWPTSGAWDADPGTPGVQPEPDPSTYNGAIWQRAREIFLGLDPGVGPDGPRWSQAMAYYQERAYGPELLWSWQGRGAAQADFGRLLRNSDEDLREATVMIGVILANHAISAADAFVSARLRERSEGRVEGGFAWLPLGVPRGEGLGLFTLRLSVHP